MTKVLMEVELRQTKPLNKEFLFEIGVMVEEKDSRIFLLMRNVNKFLTQV